MTSSRADHITTSCAVLWLVRGGRRVGGRGLGGGGGRRGGGGVLGVDLNPPRGATVWLDGVDEGGCASLAASAARVRTTLAVAAERTRVDVELAYPGGSAVRVGEPPRSLRVAPSDVASARAEVSLDGSFAGTISVWAEFDPAVRARAQTPAGDRSVSLSIAPSVRAAIREASAALAGLDERSTPAWLPLGSLWSAQHALERLVALRGLDPSHADFMDRRAGHPPPMPSDLRWPPPPLATFPGPHSLSHRRHHATIPSRHLAHFALLHYRST